MNENNLGSNPDNENPFEKESGFYCTDCKKALPPSNGLTEISRKGWRLIFKKTLLNKIPTWYCPECYVTFKKSK